MYGDCNRAIYICFDDRRAIKPQYRHTNHIPLCPECGQQTKRMYNVEAPRREAHKKWNDLYDEYIQNIRRHDEYLQRVYCKKPSYYYIRRGIAYTPNDSLL